MNDDITRVLAKIESGNAGAANELLPLVYEELRKLAEVRMMREKPGQTLQATALVHEAYLRLVGSDSERKWDSRGHFFAAAAEAMRRILLNRARDKKRQKRGGGRQRIDLDKIQVAMDTPSEELLALDEAIEMLESQDRLSADLVKLRFFAGLTNHQAAEMLGISRRSADRKWTYARAWLYERLNANDEGSVEE